MQINFDVHLFNETMRSFTSEFKLVQFPQLNPPPTCLHSQWVTLSNSDMLHGLTPAEGSVNRFEMFLEVQGNTYKLGSILPYPGGTYLYS